MTPRLEDLYIQVESPILATRLNTNDKRENSFASPGFMGEARSSPPLPARGKSCSHEAFASVDA
jgi:hypothetical protein